VLSESWQYSPAIAGELFRFTHFNAIQGFDRALICQVDTMQTAHFGTTILYPNVGIDIYRFISPECFENRSIGIKRLTQSIEEWTVFIDVWLPTMPINNPSAPNYPVSTSAASTTVAASITSVAVLASNATRKGASIWNASTATLYLDLDAVATVTDYAARLDPNGYYEVPYGYTGAIAGIWTAANGNALVREFV
jgi:hypothetical protein